MKKQTYTTPHGTKRGLFVNMMEQNHLLIAGRSGAGKSVLVNGLIVTGLYSFPFDRRGGVQYILIDPKRVELSKYAALPHVIAHATEPDEILSALQYALKVIDKRYASMMDRGLRFYDGGDLYIVIEEFADLMTTNRRAYQPLIQRICQIGRGARVHCWVITQTPIVAVLPTEIKCNFDGVVALRTKNPQDSRNIIGITGAEALPRYGECIYSTPELMKPYRYTVPYIDDDEQDAMVYFWERQTGKRGLFRRIFK